MDSMRKGNTVSVQIQKKFYSKEQSQERPIKIYLNNQPMAISQGTPNDLAELAVGFLLSEGLITDRNKLKEVVADIQQASVNVLSEESFDAHHPLMQRVTSAGCAQTALLNGAEPKVFERAQNLRFKAQDLLGMMKQLCEASPRRNSGECVHGCGVGKEGKLSCVREDIGRHNAMDKLIGQAWLDRLDMTDMALFTTGRISHEMALKASQAGVSVIVSHKSVTDAGIEVADGLGITLVGKCRNDSMQVMSHHERIVS